MTPKVGDAPRPDPTPKLDVVGSVLSASGLGLFVYGVLQSSTWGWLKPKNSPVTIFGFSLTVFVLAAEWCPDLGIRDLAALPRRQKSRPTCPLVPGTDPSGQIRVDRPVQPEPDPDGHFLRRAALPPDGPRSQRPRDRDQDVARLDHDVRHLCDRIQAVESVPCSCHRSDWAGCDSCRCTDPALDDPAHALRRRIRHRYGRARNRNGPDGVPTRQRHPVFGRRVRTRRRSTWSSSTPGSNSVHRSVSRSSEPLC